MAWALNRASIQPREMLREGPTTSLQWERCASEMGVNKKDWTEEQVYWSALQCRNGAATGESRTQNGKFNLKQCEKSSAKRGWQALKLDSDESKNPAWKNRYPRTDRRPRSNTHIINQTRSVQGLWGSITASPSDSDSRPGRCRYQGHQGPISNPG